MTNIYDDYFEIVRWAEADFERKKLVETDYPAAQCFAVLKEGFDFTSLLESIDTCDVIPFDARWSSTIMTDLPSVGDNFNYVTAPGETEANWVGDWDIPWERLTGPIIDSYYGEGMWIGSDGVDSTQIRLVKQKDQDYFGKYSGDNTILVKFKCPQPLPNPPLTGFLWAFEFLVQNCVDIADYNANAKGYRVVFQGTQVILQWFDNALAVTNNLQIWPGLVPTYDTPWILCAIIENDNIDIYIEPSGNLYPYAIRLSHTISSSPPAERSYYGTYIFRSVHVGGQPITQTTGAEVIHTSVYGRPLDFDLTAPTGFYRFAWAPEGAFPVPIVWTDDETLNYVYRADPSMLTELITAYVDCRNKIGNQAWNVPANYCYRKFDVTNQKPIAVMKVPQLVLYGVEFNVDMTQSFDPENGHLTMGVIMGDGSQVRYIRTDLVSPVVTGKYFEVSNPIDGGHNSGNGFVVRAIAVDRAALVSDEVTANIWVTPGFCLRETEYSPLSPFESIDEALPNKGVGRSNAPYLGQDILTNTFGGSTAWEISGKHMVIGATKCSKTEQELMDMALYEHLLFKILHKYGVVFKMDLGQGQIVRGVITDYKGEYTNVPFVINYNMIFAEYNKPWKAFARELIL